MPPKKPRKGQEPEAPASPLAIVRPSTPNDFRIVATVRALQDLVNTEAKWKNRLAVASRDETVVRAKIARVLQLVSLCERGITQCLANVESLVDEQFNMVSSDPAQVAAWQHGAVGILPGTNLSCAPPAAASGSASAAVNAANSNAAAGGKGATTVKGVVAAATAASMFAKGGGGTPGGRGLAVGAEPSIFPHGYHAEAEPSLAHVPPSFWAQRNAQKEQLRTMLLALYNTPRLSRERQVQRPSSPVEMQHEVEEATRLATPIAELLAMQVSKVAAASTAKTPKGAPLGKTASKAFAGRNASLQNAAAAALDDSTSIAESEVAHILSGDLAPSDCLSLPTPRGLDPKLLHRVQQQRSRRLRLEASIALFKAELPGLESRLRCIADMNAVGNYSLTAVGPAVSRTIEEEAALQRVRLQEDEWFQQRRAATPGASTSGSAGVMSPGPAARRPISTPPTSS